MNFDFSNVSIQNILQGIENFGYARLGIVIGILVLFLLLFGIAGKKLKAFLLLFAGALSFLLAYSGTRPLILALPDRASEFIQSKIPGTKNSPATDVSLPEADDGWVTVSSAQAAEVSSAALTLSDIPPYSGDPVYDLTGRMPDLTVPEFDQAYVSLSSLDSLGRCQDAFAVLGPEILPTEERGEIGMVRPSGWQTVKYPDLIEDVYLYNRCHLLAYQATGINADERNLVTGTRYMNVEGMEPYENKTTWYIKDTGNHVVYRVVPVFDKDNLVCSGVLMQALSVEDNGGGIDFCVFCYNVQPGIVIDYRTGKSRAAS